MSYTNGFFTYDTIDNNYWNQGFVDYTSKIRHDSMSVNHFSIKKVIFNDPATIVLWEDGTKTVVKCDENDGYDPEKGLAMAISKKALGNKGNYYNHLKKWLTIEKTPLRIVQAQR